jgi:Cu/Ag efflux pump CusA
MQAALRSWRVAALTFLTLPAGLAGGLLAALVVDGTQLTLGAILGLLGTFAISVRGAIVLVSRIRRLEDDEGMGRDELVTQAARDRFGPIVAGALATAALLAPFVVLGSRPGLEIVSPMAVVMLGGLVTATLMTVFALPAIYAGFAGQTERDLAEDLLYRWAGVARTPAAGQAGDTGAIVVDPDGAPPDRGRKRILSRGRRSDATEPVPEPPPKAG